MTEPTLVSRDNTDFEKQRIKYQSVELNHEQLCDAYHPRATMAPTAPM
jgi:hypothetical protein